MRGVGVVPQHSAEIPAGETDSVIGTMLRPPLQRLEWLLLAAFAATSVGVVALDLWQVVVHGRVWTGTDGVYITDQMQYLSWIVSASHSGLVANLFVVRSSQPVYLQPAILLSGLVTAAGVPPTVALLIWKPVAVGAFFFATRAYLVRALHQPGVTARVVALALTLFYGCLAPVYGQVGVVGDLFPGFLSWGYPFALLAVAAAACGLLGYDRARAEGRVSFAPGLLGALAGSLHPWQGELFVLIIVGAELVGGDIRLRDLRPGRLRSPRVRLWSLTIALAAVPLIYYYALGKLSIDWQLGQQASKHGGLVVPIAVALAPLALVALLGLRGSAGGFLGLATRVWPLAALVIYVQGLTSAGATPLHAWDGVTLPLAVLAVNGYARLRAEPRWGQLLARLRLGSWHRRRWVLLALIALFTLPATFEEMREALVEVQPSAGNANFIQPGEKRALAYLKKNRDRGAVISSPYLGMTVPGYTGRHTYDGDCIWSEPHCYGRDTTTEALLAGQLNAATARQLISGSGARFVLLACGSATGTVESELAPLTSSVTRFGCASVIEIRRATGVMARS